jgi:hypothetical protein
MAHSGNDDDGLREDDGGEREEDDGLDSSLREGIFLQRFNQSAIQKIEQNDPALKGLHMGNAVTSYDSYQVGVFLSFDSANVSKLGVCIGGNTQLELLSFDGTHGVNRPANGMASISGNSDFFHGLEQNSSINYLSFNHCDLSLDAARQVLNAFDEGNDSHLTHLSLDRCGGLGSDGGGNDILASALRRFPHMKEISISDSDIEDGTMENLLSAVSGPRHHLEILKLVGIDIRRVGFYETIACFLQDASCKLVTLDLTGSDIDDNCALVIAIALNNNSTLECLDLSDHSRLTSVSWDALFNVLCDASNIHGTYNSNHTLQSLGNHVTPTPHVFFALLMNKGPDKKLVRKKKILRTHLHFEMKVFFEWEMKMLPVVIRWFNTARTCVSKICSESRSIDARKLCAIYQFINAMPDICEHSVIR